MLRRDRNFHSLSELHQTEEKVFTLTEQALTESKNDFFQTDSDSILEMNGHPFCIMPTAGYSLGKDIYRGSTRLIIERGPTSDIIDAETLKSDEKGSENDKLLQQFQEKNSTEVAFKAARDAHQQVCTSIVTNACRRAFIASIKTDAISQVMPGNEGVIAILTVSDEKETAVVSSEACEEGIDVNMVVTDRETVTTQKHQLKMPGKNTVTMKQVHFTCEEYETALQQKLDKLIAQGKENSEAVKNIRQRLTNKRKYPTPSALFYIEKIETSNELVRDVLMQKEMPDLTQPQYQSCVEGQVEEVVRQFQAPKPVVTVAPILRPVRKPMVSPAKSLAKSIGWGFLSALSTTGSLIAGIATTVVLAPFIGPASILAGIGVMAACVTIGSACAVKAKKELNNYRNAKAENKRRLAMIQRQQNHNARQQQAKKKQEARLSPEEIKKLLPQPKPSPQSPTYIMGKLNSAEEKSPAQSPVPSMHRLSPSASSTDAPLSSPRSDEDSAAPMDSPTLERTDELPKVVLRVDTDAPIDESLSKTTLDARDIINGKRIKERILKEEDVVDFCEEWISESEQCFHNKIKMR